MTTTYPERFDPSKRYQGLAFPDKEFKAHSYDFNDLGHIQRHQLKRIANLIAADGEVVDDTVNIAIDQDTGVCTISAAQIYLDGLVHDVDAAALTIP